MDKPGSTKVRAYSRTGEAPELALAIIGHLMKNCKSEGRQYCSFSIDQLPKSVNHMYFHTRNGTRLQPWVEEFRISVKNAMVRRGISWRPTGATASVILLQSPVWITSESKIRRFDADNKIKPIFDAIEKATSQPDENHWNFHVFKVPSKREKLSVYLFDLGDVIEYFY